MDQIKAFEKKIDRAQSGTFDTGLTQTSLIEIFL